LNATRVPRDPFARDTAQLGTARQRTTPQPISETRSHPRTLKSPRHGT